MSEIRQRSGAVALTQLRSLGRQEKNVCAQQAWFDSEVRHWHYAAVAGKRKDVFVQRRIIPRLARSRTKACVSDSALTYTVFTQSSERKRAQQRANFGTQAESSVVSHLNKHDYEIRWGVKYLIPGICPLQLPHIPLYSDSYGTNTQHTARHHVM